MASKSPLNCLGCGTPIRGALTAGMMQEVTGWVEVRKKGGAHSVRDRTPTGRVLCKQCGAAKRMGISYEQDQLFEVDS